MIRSALLALCLVAGCANRLSTDDINDIPEDTREYKSAFTCVGMGGGVCTNWKPALSPTPDRAGSDAPIYCQPGSVPPDGKIHIFTGANYTGFCEELGYSMYFGYQQLGDWCSGPQPGGNPGAHVQSFMVGNHMFSTWYSGPQFMGTQDAFILTPLQGQQVNAPFGLLHFPCSIYTQPN